MIDFMFFEYVKRKFHRDMSMQEELIKAGFKSMDTLAVILTENPLILFF